MNKYGFQSFTSQRFPPRFRDPHMDRHTIEQRFEVLKVYFESNPYVAQSL